VRPAAQRVGAIRWLEIVAGRTGVDQARNGVGYSYMRDGEIWAVQKTGKISWQRDEKRQAILVIKLAE